MTPVLVALLALAQQPSPLVMRVETLSDRVAVISGYANGNLLVVAGERDVLLVDGQSERRVGLADSALRTVTPLPVRLVINTHWHDDHMQGNAHWRRQGARVLAHANVPAQAAKDTVIPEIEWTRAALPREAMPDSLFTDSLVLRIGAEEVRVVHLPRAHTDGDAVVWLPRSDIIHTGDIVETEAFPFIDWWAGGSLAGTIAAVDALLGRIGERTRVVPGHGPVVNRAWVAGYRDMLQTVGAEVQRAVARGETIEQVLASRPAGPFVGRFGSARSAERFTRVLYYGLARR